MIQPPNANDLMTPEEFAAIRDLHDRRLEEVHEQLRMTSIRDAAMALNLSEDEVRLYLASIRTEPQPEVKRRQGGSGPLLAAVVVVGLAACVAVGMLVQRALVSEPASARTSEAPAVADSITPMAEVPMAAREVPSDAGVSVAPDIEEGTPVAPTPQPETAPRPSDDPRTAMPPHSDGPAPGSPQDDGSGYPDAQYEKYSNTPADPLPTSPESR